MPAVWALIAMIAVGITLILLADAWGTWSKDLGFTLIGSALTFSFFGLYFDLRAQDQMAKAVASAIEAPINDIRDELGSLQDRLELGDRDYPVRVGGCSHGLREAFSRNECPSRVREWISSLGPRVTILNDYDWLVTEEIVESVLRRHPEGQVQIIIADDSQPSASQLWSLRHRNRPSLSKTVNEVARRLNDLEVAGIGDREISGHLSAGKADMAFLELAVVDHSDTSAVFISDPSGLDQRYERLTLVINGKSKYGEAIARAASSALSSATPLLSELPARF